MPCLASVRFDVLTVIEAPPQSDLMVELIKKLKPQVVVSGIANFETGFLLLQLRDQGKTVKLQMEHLRMDQMVLRETV
ncbi:methionine S-methyltransferase-like [Pistacia vera]|uniref:methionine S-methyltransferase-like n=1 Tax=Pistacia vera TaxID=55513 RepID=UPI001263477D|nr:methionine S-methyltransferase-like [Pistacia vera]